MPAEDPHPSALSGVFGKPFAEQVAFFRQKLGNLVPTLRWDDLTREAHDQAFMVAGAVKADLLTDLAAAVDKAISEGRGIDTFRKDFRSIVQRNGWTGWAGEGSVKGEAWRVGVIYRTNMRTSYAAGRMAQLRESKFPFWVYRHGASLEPRLVHINWNGLVLPPSHEFWRQHYPPSDWGCSCYVLGARSDAGARRLGGDPSKKLPAGWNRIDPKTGAPIGIGKGWNYAPGASVADAVNAIAGKVANWDYSVTKAFLGDLPPEQADALSSAYRNLPSTADDARSYAKGVWEDTVQPVPQPVRSIGLIGSNQAEQVTEASGIKVGGMDLRMTREGIVHIRNTHGDDASEALRGQRGVRPEDFARLPQIVDAPETIELRPDRSKSNEVLVAFSRTFDGERFTATFAINRRRGSLTLKTLFISRRQSGAPSH